MKNLTKSLVLFSFLISVLFFVSGSEIPVPNEFEGQVEVNDEMVIEGTELRVLVDGELFETVEVDEDGSYSILLTGYEDDEVSFEIENDLDEWVESNETATIGDFGEEQNKDLDFDLVDPDPKLSLGLEESDTDSLLISVSTNFLDEEGDVYLDYNGSETSSKVLNSSISSADFNVTGLDYDSSYSVTGFLETSEGEFNSSLKSFDTDNLDGLSVDGSTNLNRGSERIIAQIGLDTVYNETLNNNGDFFFTVDHQDSYNSSEVTINVKDESQYFEYSSGKSVEPEFNFQSSETLENESENQTTDNSQEEDSEESEEENLSNEEDDDSGSNNDNDDVEPESDNQEETETDSGTQDSESDDVDETLTGEFLTSQTDSTSLLLITLISILGGYLLFL